MGALKPYILSEDAKAQAEFYTHAIGAEIVSVITQGEAMGAQGDNAHKVMHMCLSIGHESYLFMADALEPFTHGSGVYLSVEYPSEAEARAIFEKLAEGGTVQYPFELQPFGLHLGQVADKFGVMWMITAEQKN